MTARTIVEKIWDAHIVADLGGGLDLLHVDRHLVHDLSGPPSLGMLAGRGLAVRNPELTFAMPDHTVSTAVGRTDADSERGPHARCPRCASGHTPKASGFSTSTTPSRASCTSSVPSSG